MRKKSIVEQTLVDLLKGVIRQVGAPPVQRTRPQAPAQPQPLSGCGACTKRR